jgi:hypothetical protein
MNGPIGQVALWTCERSTAVVKLSVSNHDYGETNNAQFFKRAYCEAEEQGSHTS